MQLHPMLSLLAVSVSAVGFGIAGCSQKAANNIQSPQAETKAQTQSLQCQLDAPYLPTPHDVVEEILKLADVKENDILYDLGSGDGRIAIAAAQKLGTRSVGVELDPQRIQEANENTKKAGVTDRVQFRQQDLFQTDLSKATVVTLYLLPDVNLKLRSKLLHELKPGTRVMSHEFDLGAWKPQRVVRVRSQSGEYTLHRDETCYTTLVPAPPREHTLYYWQDLRRGRRGDQ